MDFRFDLILESLPRLLGGAVLTLELVGLSVFIGFFIALPLALARLHPSRWVHAGPWAYIFFFRGTPLLIQIFLLYYGLSQIEFIRNGFLWPVLREAWWCALAALTLNTAAYSAEIFRGAIQSVPPGETEAARAVGMGSFHILRRITLPRAFQLALPAYGNEIIFLIKGSALVSTITLADLTGVARLIVARTYKPIEVFLATGFIYLVMIYALSLVLKRLEVALAKGSARSS